MTVNAALLVMLVPNPTFPLLGKKTSWVFVVVHCDEPPDGSGTHVPIPVLPLDCRIYPVAAPLPVNVKLVVRIVPATSSVWPGTHVPIPTLPAAVIRIRSVGIVAALEVLK